MKVLRTGTWERRFGYLGSALVGQLTEVEIDDVGVCYVRENFRLHDNFTTSSSHRLGITGGINAGKVRCGINPRRLANNSGANILELCAPASRWNRAAELVAAADSLKRRVRANRSFTIAWAERQLNA